MNSENKNPLEDKDLKKFDILFTKIGRENIDYNNIKNLIKRTEFSDCLKLLDKKFGSIKRINETDLQEIIINYNNNRKKLFKKQFPDLIERFKTYIQSEQKISYYFSPIYNLDSNIGELEIDESTKIRKIKPWETKELQKIYETWRPIKVQIPRIEFVLVISADGVESKRIDFAEVKKMQILNSFRLCSKGAIRFGGLYLYVGSENWNPRRKFEMLEFEKPGMYSAYKYKLKKDQTVRFLKIMRKIKKRYPNDDKKYEDYFEKVIRRFSSAIEKKNYGDRITDFVISMEALLVLGKGDSSLRFQQHSALLLGDDDSSRSELMKTMKGFYTFRSGQVHELSSKEIIEIFGREKLTTKQAAPEMEDLARKAIVKMIFLSQENDLDKLKPEKLVGKIEEAIFDDSLKEKFAKLGKEISFN